MKRPRGNARGADGSPRFLDDMQDFLGVGDEDLPGRGERDSAVVAVK